MAGTGEFEKSDGDILFAEDVNFLWDDDKKTTMNYGTVTASGTAAAIVAADTGRVSLTVKNITISENAWIGGTGVVAASGYPLAPNQQIHLERANCRSAVSVITDGDQADIRYVEVTA